jgi:ribonuclease D
MRNAQKVRVKHFFQAREKLAEDLNKPPFQILDKHILVSLSAKTLLNKSMLYNLINNRNFSIKKRLITSLLEAQKEAVAEIERENRK